MKKSIVIATHVFSPGTSQAFYAYCKKKRMDVLFIEHSLEGNFFTWSIGAIDVLWKVIKTKKKFDLYVGSNRLNAYLGILLRKIGRVKKVVYFSPDWVEDRFGNFLLNNIYQWLDYNCVKCADLVWNSSAGVGVDLMAREREKKGYSKKWRKKQIQVSDGTDKVKADFSRIDRFKIGFVGHLREGMGVELLIEVFREIKKKIGKAKLLVIGSGPLEEEVRRKARGLKVEFTGFIGDIDKVYKKLARCAVGVAFYEPGSITYYTDPGKIKVYLSCGLAIVITKVPQVAWEIGEKECGMAVKYDKKEVIRAVVKILKQEKLLKRYRRNAMKLADKYSWDRVFDRALSYIDF